MNNKIIVGVILAVVIIGGGMLLLSTNNQQQPATNQQQPTTAETTQPTTQEPSSSPSASQAPSGSVMKEETNTITVTETGFTPPTITIKAGTKVTWMNKSGGVANVSSDFHPTHTIYPKLNLGRFDNGTTVSLVFDTAGTYKYHDHLTPSKTGTVVVE